MRKKIVVVLLLYWVTIASLLSIFPSISIAATPVQWNDWSKSIFDQAKINHRLILLNLEAVWCHTCHVMADQTYTDPDVINIINSSYIAVKVDQDARPDLSKRYQQFGWPATIIFNSNGQELAKRGGYIPPNILSKLLQKLAHAPLPESSTSAAAANQNYVESSFLTDDMRTLLEKNQLALYDNRNQGWGIDKKSLDWDSIEYAMVKAQLGDANAERMARATLNSAQTFLLDPVWGGMYQYSTNGDWLHPQYQKIMQVQAEDMRIFADAYALWHDPNYLQTAQKIDNYLINFLSSPQGVFYASQDADLTKGVHSINYYKLNDAQRRQLGIPKVDLHIYSQENGWAINALAHLYMATGNTTYLNQAVNAAQWIIANRSLPGGGFRHDEKDLAGPFLGDNLAMGQALLSLYQATADRHYLALAQQAADFIRIHFKDPNGNAGFLCAAPSTDSAIGQPIAGRDENVSLVRFANLLYCYTGNDIDRNMAQQAMHYLTATDIANAFPPASVLLTNFELSHDPLHITIVGSKQNTQAQRLYTAALAYPSSYKRIEWWDQSEGTLPNNDIEYPVLNKPAAFVCTSDRCSLPVYNPQDITALVTHLAHLVPLVNHATLSEANNLVGNADQISLFSKEDLNPYSSSQMNPLPANMNSGQDKATQLLANKQWLYIVPGFFIFGLLLAFTPCVLPMIPILIGIIAGQTKQVTTRKAFRLSFTYVLAMSFTYSIAGVLAGMAGSYLQAMLQNPWVLGVYSFVFVLLALSLFGFYELRLPHKWQTLLTQLSNRQTGGDYIGVAMMGILSTLIVSPCVSAPLIGALSYIGKTGDVVLGGSALFVMGLGMGVPLLIVGTFEGKFLPKAGQWLNTVKALLGVLLLGVAIWMIGRIIPDIWTMMLWALLIIGTAMFLGALSATPASNIGKLWKGFSLILLVYGMSLFVGVLMGNTDPLAPLAIKQYVKNSHGQISTQVTHDFQRVKNSAALQQALADASIQKKPVLLDFYADWCVSCKEMQSNTFSDPAVQNLMQQFVLLRADVTANNTDDVALSKQFNVIGPPVVVFFDATGKLLPATVVGYMNPKDFIQQLQQALGVKNK